MKSGMLRSVRKEGYTLNSLFHDHDGVGLAELVKRKEVHPKELVEASIQAIEALNPSFNAVIHKMYDQALEQAHAEGLDVNRPLAGVPVLLKDVSQDVKGEPMTFGSKSYLNHRSKEDSTYASRIRESGGIVMGFTNVPEFALMAITEPKRYGPTRNPWDRDVTPGGSSGGSAAAVACGMVPIAGASDGGGSIRIPAAYCGLFGLKPTRGRTPIGPEAGRHWQGASVNHVLTRTVRDSAAVLDVLAGDERSGAFMAPPPRGRFLDVLGQPLPKPLRIAYSVTSPMGTDVDQACQHAVLDAVRLLESMGHHVEEKSSPVDGRKIAKSYITMYFAEVGAQLQSLEQILGRKARRTDVEPTTWLLGKMGDVTSAAEFALSLQEWDKAALQMEQFHDTFDVYLTPTTAMLPSRIGEMELGFVEKALVSLVDKFGIAKALKRGKMLDALIENSLKRTPFTQLANLTGQPAVSLPLYQTSEGLPLGVQVMAARGREELLLQLASELEKTPQWIDVRQNPSFLRTT